MRVLAAFAVTAAAALLLVSTAASATPANDDFNAATVVAALPFTDSVDMSTATVAPDDPIPSCSDANGNGPGTVWYAFTPTVDTLVGYNTFGSSAEQGVAVFTGSRGSLRELLCSGGFGTPPLLAVAGRTYYFLIYNFNGSLVFNIGGTELPPDTTPPNLFLPADLTVQQDSAAGATVFYSAGASDDRDPSPLVLCTPPSGSTFPIGTTTVFCRATDASGNVASGSFQVTVLPFLSLRVRADTVGTVNPQTGLATIGGTVSCGRPAQVDVSGLLRQEIANRAFLDGLFDVSVTCLPPSVPWMAQVTAQLGRYKAGKARTEVTAIVCQFDCPQVDQFNTDLTLKGTK